MLLIDTNIAIHNREADVEITSRLLAQDDAIAISLLTQVELEGGIYAKRGESAARRTATDAMLRNVVVLALDSAIVATYGQIVAICGFSRPRIIDRLIAATAIVHGLTLVTINGPDVRDIPGLLLEVWPTPDQ